MGKTDNVQKQRAKPIAFSSPSPSHQGEGAQRADGGQDIQGIINNS